MMQGFWKIRTFLWSVFSKRTVGARALVIQDNQVLLVKHTYLPGWCTIGGGVDRRESGLQALKRELMEEVGVTLNEEPSILGFYHKNHKKWDDYIILYVCKNVTQTPVKSPEIQESCWFSFDKLPVDITPATKRRIQEYLNECSLSDMW